MPRKKLRAVKKVWEDLPWKKISVEDQDLGEFDDSIFFGLEEVDGSEYEKHFGKGNPKKEIASVEHDDENNIAFESADAADEQKVPDVSEKSEKKPKKKKEKKKKEKNNRGDKDSDGPAGGKVVPKVSNTNSSWSSSVSLHNVLVNALVSLNFKTPTPIQSSSIPLTLSARCDLVGSAETGSGKTLAFGLPIVHSLLHDWKNCCNMHTPYALILAPTRELAKQITSVLSDLCRVFQNTHKIQVVNVIGGMSEHKQRRQLSGTGKPVHIVVATPGRLCDLINDTSVIPFKDLSNLRYLVIDEADRMVEEGHFPELFRVFSRIREHEKIAASGRDPVEVERLAALGTDYNDMEEDEAAILRAQATSRAKKQSDAIEDAETGDDSELDLCDDLPMLDFDTMPSEADIEAARRQQSAQPIEMLAEDEDEEDEEGADKQNAQSSVMSNYVANKRQTLLFSATAMGVGAEEERGGNKKRRLQSKLEKSLGGKKKAETLKALGIPDHLRQLLEAVGIQDTTRVAHGEKRSKEDVEAKEKEEEGASAASSKDKKRKLKDALAAPPPEELELLSLPKGLTQEEIRMPTEDKDSVAYFFLLKHPGRTLIFVNSIKTARRLDGLLRALEVNCRTIHSQLQQKQRIKSLEAFTSSPICCLVATDVAARGLDLPKVQYVLHYDIARSPQVYVHRSGRTARAGQQGTALSLVSPEDTAHHQQICSALKLPSLPSMRMDLSSAPIVRERVKLAKKIFTESFVASQKSKDKNWLETSARDADLVVDDMMLYDIESALNSKGQRQHRDEKMSKKSLDKERRKLRLLLQEPFEADVGRRANGGGGVSRGSGSGIGNRRNGRSSFIVVAK